MREVEKVRVSANGKGTEGTKEAGVKGIGGGAARASASEKGKGTEGSKEGKGNEGSKENELQAEDDGRNDGEWKLIQNRRRKVSGGSKGRIDIAGSGVKNVGETISFYFSDFPSSHGAKEMLKAFALYGKVVEVVIPPKRNKWGKRFGFVRFAEVQDPRVFAVQLDNIIFGSDKIHVNIPRFGRETHLVQSKKAHNGKIIGPTRNNIATKVIVGNVKRSWKEVVKGRNEEGGQTGGRGVNVGGADGGVDGLGGGRGGFGPNRNIKKNWIPRHQHPEQRIVYYRQRDLCDVWYNNSEEE